MIFFGKWSSLGCLDNDLAKSWVQLWLLITQGINMLLKDIFKCLTLFIKLRFLWIGICCREITMKSVEVWFNSPGSNKIWFAAKLLSIWYTLCMLIEFHGSQYKVLFASSAVVINCQNSFLLSEICILKMFFWMKRGIFFSHILVPGKKQNIFQMRRLWIISTVLQVTFGKSEY